MRTATVMLFNANFHVRPGNEKLNIQPCIEIPHEPSWQASRSKDISFEIYHPNARQAAMTVLQLF